MSSRSRSLSNGEQNKFAKMNKVIKNGKAYEITTLSFGDPNAVVPGIA